MNICNKGSLDKDPRPNGGDGDAINQISTAPYQYRERRSEEISFSFFNRQGDTDNESLNCTRNYHKLTFSLSDTFRWEKL